MGKKSTIDHIGIIQEISDKIVRVKIENQSACAGCHANGACSMADVKEKYIDINTPIKENFNIGEKVNVVCDEELGFIALFWAYIFPLILIFTTLIIGNFFTEDEKIYGGLSLIVLVPYFLILRLFKNKLKKRFSFRIDKIK